MKEADLKRALCAAIREALPGAVVYRHEDMFATGMPDISVTLSGRVVWIEVKFEKLGRKSKPTELQEAALRKLGGVLVTYGLARDGRRAVSVTEYARLPEAPRLALALAGKTFFHRDVAAYVQARLDVA